MPKHVVVISGPVASGKTALANNLVNRYHFVIFKTRGLISRTLNVNIERTALQKAGEKLDRGTKGRWVADTLSREVMVLPPETAVVVDSVRTLEQVDAIREALGSRVIHVHLTAASDILASRYATRSGPVKELGSYAAVQRNPTERNVERLSESADLVINTGPYSESDVFTRVASFLGYFGKAVDRTVDVLVGGQYGSEGKGHIASYLAPDYALLIRVGGPNAGHKVYEEPEPYTHHHLPSGTRCSRAKLVIGPGAVLYVPDLLKEITECEVTHDRLAIDPQAMVIEDEDRRFEARTLKKSIGSTGQGVGAATSRKVLRRAARPRVRFARDIRALRHFVRETQLILDDAFARGDKIFLEGTQGTGLSLHHGTYPYVTSRDTTVSGCLSEAGIAPNRVRRVIMVCRTYPIRVQSPRRSTSGPMTIETTWQVVSDRSGVPVEELEEKERTSTTNRERRVCEFDWTLLRKAASLNGPTDIALTFADYISLRNRAARRFEQLTDETIRFIEEIERVASTPVSLIATRFHSRSIIDRRNW